MLEASLPADEPLDKIHLRKRGLFADVISRKRLPKIYVPFVGSTYARSLSVQPRQVTDASLANLDPLTEIQQLNLDRTSITDTGLAHLKNLSNLTNLSLYSCPTIDGSGFVHLKDMKQLRGMILHGTRVNDAGLAHLHAVTSLEGMNMIECPITDAGLARISHKAGE